MLYLRIIIYTIIIGLFSSCSLFEKEDEDCPITAFPLTQDDLRVTSETYYRGLVGAELFYITGECFGANADVDWQYSGTGEFVTPGNSMNTFELTESGTLCGQLMSGGGVSERICQDIQVYRDHIWGLYHEEFPSGRSKQQITMTLNGSVYSGFGSSNNWYRFDTTTFAWEERAHIANIIGFDAYAGFAIHNKAFIIGNNSKYYEYNPEDDNWIDKGVFPENVSNLLGLGSFGVRTDFNFPVIGLASGEKGYFGIGYSTHLYEYDPSSDSFKKLADRPERAEVGDHSFAFKGKIYNGKYVYDIESDTWSVGENNFNIKAGFSPGFVPYKGVMYGGKSGVSVTFSDSGFEEVPLDGANKFTTPPTGFHGNGAAIGNYIIYPRLMGGVSQFEARVWYYMDR